MCFPFNSSVYISYLTSADEQTWKGVMLAVVLTLLPLLEGVLKVNAQNYWMEAGVKIRSSINGLIFRKVELYQISQNAFMIEDMIHLSYKCLCRCPIVLGSFGATVMIMHMIYFQIEENLYLDHVAQVYCVQVYP